MGDNYNQVKTNWETKRSKSKQIGTPVRTSGKPAGGQVNKSWETSGRQLENKYRQVTKQYDNWATREIKKINWEKRGNNTKTNKRSTGRERENRRRVHRETIGI